jgi:flagellar biogenesis protein FliO
MERGMQFITALFGESGNNTLLNSAFALGLVLVLIVLGTWVLKLFTRAGSNLGRGRNARLKVVDAAMVDGKRQVIIVRRDNVEHLIMTGGPQDLIIESGIPVAEPAPQARRAAAVRPQSPPQPAPRPATAEEIATPIVPDRPVARDVVDRLNDLARPAPLAPRASLRRTALLRPVESVIPMSPAHRPDNSAGVRSDSAKTGAVSETSGQTRVVAARNRFFRNVVPGDRT